jgi:hypothetical protein
MSRAPKKTLETTMPFTFLLTGASIPLPFPVFTHRRASLSSFEIYLSSLVDGARTVRELADTASISEAEVRTVLQTLFEHHVVDIRASPTAPVRPPPLPVRARAARSADACPTLRDQDMRCVEVLHTVERLERDGDPKAAEGALRDAIVQTRNASALYNRLALLIANHKKAFREADSLLRLALRLEPDNREYERNLTGVQEMAAARLTQQRKVRAAFLQPVGG